VARQRQRSKTRLAPKPYLREISLKRDQIASYDAYPFNLPAVHRLDRLEFHPDVTFIIGENGSGKSTLLEAIAVAWGFNPEGGTINFNFSTRSSHSDLHKRIRLVRSVRRPRDGFFLRAESYFNLATDIEQMDAIPSCAPPVINSYGGVYLHNQSHGESFLALLLKRFGGNGLYILDEPEAALSPARQLAVIRRIHELVLKDSQFIIATHSPIIMAYPRAKILCLDGDGFHEVRYEETEHYVLTKEFMNNPMGMIDRVLAEDEAKDGER
jgi:predicted ATPase